MTIILVEDHNLNRKLFSDFLEIGNFANEAFSTIASAKERLSKKPAPNLIILDIHFDESSGIELAEWCRAQTHLKNIAIMAISAFAMREDKEKALKAGINKYLIKPVDLDSFLQEVKSLIG